MRRGSALLLSVVLGATVAACADTDVVGDTAVRAVTVRPRVVVDGTVELADRTDDRIVIEGIVAHATEARVLDAADAVVVDDQALFFNFAPDHVDDQVAAEREWHVPVEGGVITMGFGPADGLSGHTAVIHGTIAVSSMGFTAFGDVVESEPAGEVDPDGTPARPEGDPAGEVDPDGTPARPIKGEVDPDGSPARPEGDPDDVAVVGEVDPDGTPARPAGSPDGTPGKLGAVDPDGTPARPTRGEVDPDGSPARNGIVEAMQKASEQVAQLMGFQARGQVHVPFTLYVDGAFDTTTSVTADDLATVGADEVLPLDLRLSAADLFTAERLAELTTLARQAVAAGRGEQGLAVAMSASSTARLLQIATDVGVDAVVAVEPEARVDRNMSVSAIR